MMGSLEVVKKNSKGEIVEGLKTERLNLESGGAEVSKYDYDVEKLDWSKRINSSNDINKAGGN